MAWSPTIVDLGNGHRTNARTRDMMLEAERLGGNLVVVQGSYHKGVAASAGTHDGGGVLDFSVNGLNQRGINGRIRALRTVGFAAWYRSPLPGVWGPHMHCVAIGTADLAPLARTQVDAYRNGRNGLKGNGPDPHAGLGIAFTTWGEYQQKKAG